MKIWTRMRFFIALWGGKFFLFLYRHTGREKNDRPGMVSMRLFDDFLKYVAKPKLTVVVTGTNGKTTISNILASVLRMQGMTVSMNEWGANYRVGQARCLLDAVNIFNRPTKDAAIIEADELTSPQNMPYLEPDYIIVNNLARDSMRRNAYPEYIYEQLEKAINGCPKAVVILNGDDPISSSLGEDNRRIHFGVSDQHTVEMPHVIDDFGVCPVCGGKPQYHYRNYRHIGDYYCPNCGLKAPERDYFAVNIDYKAREITVREPDGSTFLYPLISASVFNAYNLMAVISILRDIGIPQEDLARNLRDTRVPSSRESRDEVMGIELITQLAKGQNATAVSTVFEHLSKDPASKELILILDENFDPSKESETVCWIYETDYELLKNDSIKKIIVGGARYLDYRLRLLLAGIPEEKFVCVRRELDTVKYVDTAGIDKIYVLHNDTAVSLARKVRDAVKQRILEERGGRVEA